MCSTIFVCFVLYPIAISFQPFVFVVVAVVRYVCVYILLVKIEFHCVL